MLEKQIEQLWNDREFEKISKIASRLVKKEKIGLTPYHLQLLGVSCSIKKRFKLGLRFLKESYQANPQDLNSVLNYGNCLKDSGDFFAAREVYNAGGFTSVDPQIFTGSIICDLELRDFSAAFAKAEFGVQSFPNDARVLYQSARAKFKFEKINDAYKLYKKAIEIDPGYEPAALNLAVTAMKAGDVDLAVHLCTQIMDLNRGSSEFLQAFMTVSMEMAAPFAGIFAFEKAPKHQKTPVIKYVAAELCRFTKNNEAAITLCKEVVSSDPTHASAYLTLYHTQCGLGLFAESAHSLAKFKKLVNKPESPIHSLPNPWTAFAALESANDQAILALKYANVELNRLPRSRPNGTLRSTGEPPAVGFVSPDFGMHPVSECLIPLLKQLKGRVKLFALSLRKKETEDEMTPIVEALFDKFYRCADMSYDAIQQLCQAEGIDTVVDLAGYTAHGRPSFFALGLARRQISFLGYSGTTGSHCYDGIVADKFLITSELEKYYTEPVISLDLPMMSCAVRSNEKIDRMPRARYGIEEDPVLFACLANAYKYSKTIVDAWIAILKETDGSEILLADAEDKTKQRILEYFSAHGIEKKRIHFARREETRLEHLSRLKMVDIFLDSWPYNAHSLAADALTAGVPLVTLSSESFASRVAGSLISGFGLGDLVANSKENYVEIAAKLGSNKALIEEKKKVLRTSLLERDWIAEYADEFVEKVVLGPSRGEA